MIHQPTGGFSGQTTDIEIHAKEAMRVKDKLNHILSQHTGRPFKQVVKDTERDYFMTPEEAKEYGIIDEIIVKRPEKKEEE
jgi:ATP-dependent Clp protease protease subunit